MMGPSIFLLNLDTGDFIDVGKVFKHAEAVPEVGYEAEHHLLNYLPNIPYGLGGNRESDERWLNTMKKKGHALNAFLAASVGCRFILVPENEVMDRIDEVMEGFGNLDNIEVNNEIVDYNGEFISEGTDFYRKRLRVNSYTKYECLTDIDVERIRQKKIHYGNEIKRALDMNKTYKRTGVDHETPGDIKEDWVYSMGQKPVEPTL